ncbi:MAG: hydroxyacylglutathione hydrolase [Ahniella sp.]|nr:hydroxyacylglutathione hydrolase [Ahniella sp.]
MPQFSLRDDVRVSGLPAFGDNYLWLVVCGGAAVVVDPGDSAVVSAALAAHSLSLQAILLTHHHPDHIGGVAALKSAWHCPVFGPDDARVPADHRVQEGDSIHVPALRMTWDVWAVPGHTRSHLAYLSGDTMFVGDTLFGGGCGRVFEGDPASLFRSLQRIASLPGETRVCAAHEYTLDNLRFALELEPDNEALIARYARTRAMRAAGQPTLPMLLADECASNPFLRTDQPGLRARAALHAGMPLDDAEATFKAIRAWKNSYVAKH